MNIHKQLLISTANLRKYFQKRNNYCCNRSNDFMQTTDGFIKTSYVFKTSDV